MVGESLKELLYIKRRSQVWLANECGVSKSHINQIISGKSNPSLRLLLRMSEVLNVDPKEMLRDPPLGGDRP